MVQNLVMMGRSFGLYDCAKLVFTFVLWVKEEHVDLFGQTLFVPENGHLVVMPRFEVRALPVESVEWW